jgi:hypothetical protein
MRAVSSVSVFSIRLFNVEASPEFAPELSVAIDGSLKCLTTSDEFFGGTYIVDVLLRDTACLARLE